MLQGFIITVLASYHLTLVVGGAWIVFYSDLFVNRCAPWGHSGFWGLLGCACYCARGLYLHFCVDEDWNNRWIVWHIIRPFVGIALGAVSYLFIKSGLLLVGADNDGSGQFYGIYALAFIAGFNIDNFLKKIERVSLEFFGIEKTRGHNKSELKNNQNDKERSERDARE